MTSQALPLIRLGHLVKHVATCAVPFRGVLQTHDLLQWQVVLPPLSSIFSLSTIELGSHLGPWAASAAALMDRQGFNHCARSRHTPTLRQDASPREA
jgi:hypothetical protein